MKLKMKLILSAALSVLILSVGTMAYAQINQPSDVVTDQDQTQLSKMHISLNDHIDPNGVTKVDQALALQNANTTFPQWAHDATGVKVEFHLLTNSEFKGFSQKALDKDPNLSLNGMVNQPVYYV
jgi:hypothetical protein